MTRSKEDDIRDYGEAFEVNGERVDPERVTVYTGKNVKISIGEPGKEERMVEMTTARVSYPKLEPSSRGQWDTHKFRLNGVFTPTPEWEAFVKSIRLHAMIVWLNKQPSMRDPLNSVSTHAIMAVGIWVSA